MDQIVKLKLFFKNLHETEIPEIKDVPFIIEYPNGQQVRPWKINIPNLKNERDCCFSESNIFFNPEVPGSHRLIIGKIPQVQYADLCGVTDRELKQIGKDWSVSFHIYSSLELRFYETAILALLISILSLILSLK